VLIQHSEIAPLDKRRSFFSLTIDQGLSLFLFSSPLAFGFFFGVFPTSPKLSQARGTRELAALLS
jgi:hypothetical protein